MTESLEPKVSYKYSNKEQNLDTTMTFKLGETLLGIICWKFSLVCVTNNQVTTCQSLYLHLQEMTCAVTQSESSLFLFKQQTSYQFQSAFLTARFSHAL